MSRLSWKASQRFNFRLFILRQFAMSLVISSAALAATATPPQGSPASRCAAAKIAASGEYMQAVLTCYAQARVTGLGVGRECVQKALLKLKADFQVAERGGACKTTGDSASVASRIDTDVTPLNASLREPAVSLCAAGKLFAMGKDAERQHACYADAVAKGVGFSVDSGCQNKATSLFLTLFSLTANLKGCVAGTKNATALDAMIRETVRSSRTTVAPPRSTCAPIEVTTLHGTSFSGNSRIAKIENGQVPCMNVETAGVATCSFSTASGAASGEWLDSPQGRYALVGQAISLTGQPGGDHVVASRVSDATPTACIEPTSMDTLGQVMAGYELTGICTIEEPLADYNALSAISFAPLLNFADQEVCMKNAVHPDGAELSSSYSSTGSGPHDTFCYRRYGAALNDINGVERDEFYDYFVGENFCHFMVNNGFEVPAAKRPATVSFPVPRYDPQSFLLWRPVASNIFIANKTIPTPPAPPQVFTDKDSFEAASHATNATGALPNLGLVANSVSIGEVTLSLAPGGDSMAVGAAGTPAAPDWMPLLPGNDIALGFENLQVQVDAGRRAYALGFEFYEPNLTMPAYGGIPGDSTFQVVLYLGTREVGRFTFNAPDDQPAFIGVTNPVPFDRVTIVDTTGNDDDEYFGQFYMFAVPN